MSTQRFTAVRQVVERGYSVAEIAARLGVANKTARNALSALYAKLGVEGRPQAIVALREQGFGS